MPNNSSKGQYSYRFRDDSKGGATLGTNGTYRCLPTPDFPAFVLPISLSATVVCVSSLALPKDTRREIRFCPSLVCCGDYTSEILRSSNFLVYLVCCVDYISEILRSSNFLVYAHICIHYTCEYKGIFALCITYHCFLGYAIVWL